MLRDWLKNLTSVFQSMRGETKTNICTMYVRDPYPLPVLSRLQVIAGNSDRFIMLFPPVVIGQSKYFGFSFSFYQKLNYHNESVIVLTRERTMQLETENEKTYQTSKLIGFIVKKFSASWHYYM